MASINKINIPVVSFFSGGGFLDMGFEQAGFTIVWTNENNELFAKMHSDGITSWRKSIGNGIKAEIFNTSSISEINPNQILQEAFPIKKPEIFGIIGGPPCQDFSSSGNNKGFRGKRGKLSKIFFEYINQISPDFFVFENVKNLFNNNKHRRRLEIILKSLGNKYYIEKKVLNALNFGIPQDRNRLFVIGFKKDRLIDKEKIFNFPKSNKYNDSLKKYNWPDVHEFQNGTKKPHNIPIELCIGPLMLNEENENSVPNGTDYFVPYSDLFNTIEEGNTHNRSFKRLHRYRYSPTACYGNNEVHLHPYLPRRISVREALRIQTVPDEYILPADIGLSYKFKMIGNGVPVKLAERVAAKVYRYLLGNHKYFFKKTKKLN